MTYDLHTLRGDIFGGVTAAIVALPVALAFGVASGLGPAAGLYSAIAMGFCSAPPCSAARGPRFPVPRADDGGHGGHRHQPRHQFVRSPDGGCHGGTAAGSPGRIADRPLRGLHAACRHFRIHVRHWHHRHIDPDHAVSRRACRIGWRDGRASRVAGGGCGYQCQRLGHRRSDARCRDFWPQGLAKYLPGPLGGADRRNGFGGAMASRMRPPSDIYRPGFPNYSSRRLPRASWRAPWSRPSSSPCSVPWTAFSPRSWRTR